MSEIVHGGSGYVYSYYGCRCEECTAAHRARVRRRRAERAREILADPSRAEHGRVSTYLNWGCRCPECTAAQSASCADYRRRKATS